MHLALGLTLTIAALTFGLGKTTGESSSLRNTDSRSTAESVESAIPALTMGLDGMPDQHRIELSIDGTPVTIQLHQKSIRHPDFQLIIDHGSHETQSEPDECGTYRGYIMGRPDSKVALHHGASGWNGVICADDGGKPIFIQPCGRGDDLHTLRRGSLEELPAFCDVTQAQSFLDTDTPMQGTTTSTRRLFDISIDVDKAYADLLGGSESVILSDVESIINVVDLIFESDLNLDCLLTTVIIRENANTYPSETAQGLTCDAMELWNSSAYSSNHRFNTDAVQVFTGKELNQQIGYAYIGTACFGGVNICGGSSNTPNKSCVESRFTNDFPQRVALSAHEFAHTLGAYHCNSSPCSIMCSSIGFCDGINGEIPGFGTNARTQIGNYLNSSASACIDEPKEPSETPYVSDFTNDAIGENTSLEQWDFALGTSITGTGQSQGDKCCLLQPYSSSPDFYSSLITKKINLADKQDGTITMSIRKQTSGFFTQTLKIDGLDRTGNWINLETIVTPYSTPWTAYSIDLPETMHWNEARFRIRGIIYAGSWFIDDVEVDASELVLNDGCMTPQEIQSGIITVTNSGATQSNPQVDQPCGETQDQLVDLWFEYEAECSGIVTVTTCQLNTLDFKVRVYQDNDSIPCDQGGVLTRISCGQTTLCPDTGNLAEFDATAGERYLIQCGTNENSTGSGIMFVSCEPVEEPECVGDLNGDDTVDGQDLATLLASWGDGKADLDGDGVVAGPDLAIVLGAWGDCK